MMVFIVWNVEFRGRVVTDLFNMKSGDFCLTTLFVRILDLVEYNDVIG